MLLRICLILAILAGAGTIFFTQKMARENLQHVITVRDENIKGRADEKKRAERAEKDLASTRTALSATSNTLVKTEEELTGKKQELATAQERLGKTTTELGKANETIKTLEANIAKWESLNLKPEQIRDMIATLKKSQDAIAALDAERAILVHRVKELENQVALILGDQNDEDLVHLPSGTKGRVVAVDPKWNFVVLDIGKDKEILQGGVLLVHRDSHLVGKVRIREVLQNRSVATVMPGWALAGIEEGDQVISKN